jgi:quercetin dioxygenase-like cupin family protein
MKVAKTWLGAAFALAALATFALSARPAAAVSEVKVTELFTQQLKDAPGKEVLMLMVDYPPSGADPVHRHDAHGFVYVLEGSVVMGVEGGKETTLKPGEIFYEGPDDIHVVGRNASSSEPAKFLVFLIKQHGVPPVLPVP